MLLECHPVAVCAECADKLFSLGPLSLLLPMSSPAKLRQKKAPVFTPAERKVLNRHKAEYIRLRDKASRHSLIVSKVLVDLFNYYASENQTSNDPEWRDQKIMVCSYR